MRELLASAGLLLALYGAAAFACGHCIEDKVASVYDHAVVTRALAMQHQVLFFAIDGRVAGTDRERQILERMAASVYGVDAGSVRVSTEEASLSVAIDPSRAPFAAIERSLQNKLARKGWSVQLLRIMHTAAEFNPRP